MYSDLQKQVIETARKQIENEPWYKGICLDKIPSDSYIQKEGIENCASSMAMETAMWDDPNFYTNLNLG